jgi:hypothetical protein
VSAQTPASRTNGATIALIALHAALVLLTLLLNVTLLFTEADPHDQCRIHNLNCDRGAHLQEAVLISVVGSAALIILELVLATRPLRKRRRLSLTVALLCCIGQLIIACAAFSLGTTGMG